MRSALTLAFIITMSALLIGCGSNPPANSEKASEKPVTAESSPNTAEVIPADPYAAMEMERNAVKESLSGKISEVPQGEGNPKQKVYSGIVEIVGKGTADQAIVLNGNRGTYLLVGEKSTALVSDEGKFVTVMGKPTKGNAVPNDAKDMEQIEVAGIVRLKTGK
jgi:hypothetical protein